MGALLVWKHFVLFSVTFFRGSRAASNRMYEAEVRKSGGGEMKDFKCNALRKEVDKLGESMKAGVERTKQQARLRKEKDDIARFQEFVEPTMQPPSNWTTARWVKDDADGADLKKILMVPCAKDPFSSFDPKLWSAMDPKCFVYGDGVYGIERRVKLSFRAQ